MSKPEGTVETTESGKSRVRFRINGSLRTIETFATPEEAEAHRATYARLLVRGKTTTSLGAYGPGVIDERELDDVTTADTAYNERLNWKNHVVSDDLGKLAIGEVDHDDVKAWLKRLGRKGLSRQTRQHCANLLRAVMNAAIETKPPLHKGPSPVPTGLKFKKDKRTVEPWTFLLPDEQDRIIAVTPAPLDALVEVAIGCGIRAGELASLRLIDVHLEGESPHLVVRYGGAPIKGHVDGRPPKGNKIRTVPLFGRALAAARRWVAALATFCPHNPLGLMFPGARGGRRDHSHVLGSWSLWKGRPARAKQGDRRQHAATTGVVARAGIARNVRWHDLRHTCATSLLNGWWGRTWTLAEVSAMLGHTSITTTERYAHVADTLLKRAARETAAALALVVPPGAEQVFQACSRLSEAASEILSDINGAGHRVRTGDFQLGKLALYQLS
jgi:integrase